jgi:TolB protein
MQRSSYIRATRAIAGYWLPSLLILSVIGCAPSISNTSEGRIAFSSNRDGFLAIYVMHADGSDVTRVTNKHQLAYEPAWSPDGTRLAFTVYHDRTSYGEIHVINADGSTPTRLTENTAGDGQPAWSPDGTQLAFTSTRDGNSEIYVMNTDGSAPTRLTWHPGADADPAWSPDGTRLAFTSTRDGEINHLYIMQSDGTDVTRLTKSTVEHDYMPTWSPDGRMLAFHALSMEFDSVNIRTITIDGASRRNLTRSGGDSEPSWSMKE